MRALEASLVWEIDAAGPELARSLTDLCLVDEYRPYFRPVVPGHGTPFFAGHRPPLPLRLIASDRVGDGMVWLTYVRVRSRVSAGGLDRSVTAAFDLSQPVNMSCKSPSSVRFAPFDAVQSDTRRAWKLPFVR